jgi:3-deoxy-D-manno-octulosonate 8-phosphate phosphatase (KDO 8-P phosphatase)
MHSLLSDDLNKPLSKIRPLLLDVDGVMTDSSIFFAALDDEIKSFNILDGQGIKSLLLNNIEVAAIKGRTSPLTEKRARDLGIKHITQGREGSVRKVFDLNLCAKGLIDDNYRAFLG